MAGHSRSKNGVALLAYVPAISFTEAAALPSEITGTSPMMTEERVVQVLSHLTSNKISCAPCHNAIWPSAARFSSPDVSVMKWLPASWPILLAKCTAP